MTLRDQRGKAVTLGGLLGKGGEAEVYAVAGRPGLVAKVYHAHAPGNADKLKAMVDHPPANPMRRKGHIAICWPESMLFDASSRCVGFLMPLLDRAKHRELFHLYNPMDRRVQAPNFTWAYLLKTAENIAIVLESIHAKGYVVGDINESNFFVSDQALVTLVDCDSMQVRTPTTVFCCTVAKSEYLAPELQGKDLSAVDRGPEQDNFALAVLLFLLLMEGVHPYSGVWNGPGDPPPMESRIARGDCPYAGSTRVKPMPSSPPFDLLPANLRSLFAQAFGQGSGAPSARPSARHWREALGQVSSLTCSRNKHHVYPKHLASCPWCERTQMLGGFDPFPAPGPIPVQQPLKPRPFAPAPPLAASAPPSAARQSAASRTWFQRRPGSRPRRSRTLGLLTMLLPGVAALASLAAYQGQTYAGRFAYIWATWVVAAFLGLILNTGRRRQARALLNVFVLGGSLWFLLNRASGLMTGLQTSLVLVAGAFFGSRSTLLLLRSRIERARAVGRQLPIVFASLIAMLMPAVVASVAALGETGAFERVRSAIRASPNAAGGQPAAAVMTCARPQSDCGCQGKGSFRPGETMAVMLHSQVAGNASLTVVLPGSAAETIALPNRWRGNNGALCITASLPIPRNAKPGWGTVRANLPGSIRSTVVAKFLVAR